MPCAPTLSCRAHPPCHAVRTPLSCCAQSQHPERPVERSEPEVPGLCDCARNDEVEDSTPPAIPTRLLLFNDFVGRDFFILVRVEALIHADCEDRVRDISRPACRFSKCQAFQGCCAVSQGQR